MSPAELAIARAKALDILQAHLDRPRPTGPDSLSAYMAEDLLLAWLARTGYPMMRPQLNGAVMTYLKDAGFAQYRAEQPWGPKGLTILMWRITGEGMQILEGTATDPGVEVR